jgi:pimeloyl-ACP methyl ester carboxylesterase
MVQATNHHPAVGPVSQVDAGLLNVGYADVGPANGRVAVLLHRLALRHPQRPRDPLPPAVELQWWYQYSFATERGRAGYDRYRREFAKLIWRTASPKWAFGDATFDRSAAAFDNPDHVEIVIHDHRWRLGLADGEPDDQELKEQLAHGPVIGVPTITLEGDANGAPHPDPSSSASKFSGPASHRTIEGGVGHNLPQEAPEAFANAVIEVDPS